MINYSKKFLSAINNENKLAEVYSDWLESLFPSQQLWSENNIDGNRIPWGKRGEIQNKKDFSNRFESKGMYIFGTKENIIRYIGITTDQIFKKRFNRYISSTGQGQKAQCQLANIISGKIDKTNYKTLQEGAWNNKGDMKIFYRLKNRYHMFLKNIADEKFIPKDVINYSPRCKGAIDFALHGIDGVWFSILEINDVKALEKQLIPIANEYNCKKGHLPLLNVQYAMKKM